MPTLSGSSENVNVAEERRALATDEVWLMWKLGQRADAQTKAEEMYAQDPRDTAVLEFLAMAATQSDRFDDARRYIAEAEAIKGETRMSLELKADIAFRCSQWEQAARDYARLMAMDRQHADYRILRALAVEYRHRWREAAAARADALELNPASRELLWDYRRAAIKGLNTLTISHEYVHGPASLKNLYRTFEWQQWISDTERVNTAVFSDNHRIGSTDARPSINASLSGIRLRYTKQLTDQASWFAQGKGIKPGMHESFAAMMGTVYETTFFKSTQSLTLNETLVSPIEATAHEGKEDVYDMLHEIYPFEGFRVAYHGKNQWFRVDPDTDLTTSTNKYIGRKWTSECLFDYKLWGTPALYLTGSRTWADWIEKPSVIDMVEDEQMTTLGLNSEQYLGKDVRIAQSIARGYDDKREFYATYSRGELEWWIDRNTLRLLVTAQYDHGAQGTGGAGNTTQSEASLTWLF
jgi:tetratricopeptide (TPR) repeat protein